MKNYVIIGGGVASVGCIEGIRSIDKTGKIILISGENKPVYCRPLISYYLQGKTDFKKMQYRPDSFYKENNCEIVYGKADKIDPDNKIVAVGKEKIKYDKLCIATGSSPFVPPFKGLETVKNKFSFMTEEDALALENAILPSSRVLIVGAGLIGLKCAEGLSGRVSSIIVCDLATRVLSSILDDECALFMQKKLEENGISFMLGDSVNAFNGNVATMSSGKTIEFDVLVLAVGVRPNIALVKDVGCNTDRGIIVDTAMKTSLENVYAIGDCAQGYDASIKANRILAIWPNAVMQGNCAGINMAGGSTIYDYGIPMNAIGFFGLHALTAGSYTGEMYEEKTDKSIKRLFIKDGCLVGFMLIGEIARAGIYTSFIREKTPLDSVNTQLLKISPTLSVFDVKNRRKKLGGMV